MGVFVIHGVGNQKAGSTTKLVAGKLEDTFRLLGIQAEASSLRMEAGCPVTSELHIGQQRPVLVAEGYWADIVRNERNRGVAAALGRAKLILAVLPYLLAAAIMPRAHEVAKARVPAERKRWRFFKSWQESIDDMIQDAPTIWRSLSLLTVFLFIGTTLAAIPFWWQLVTLIAVLLAGGAALSWNRDVVEHIRVVTMKSDTIVAIEARLTRDLRYVSRNCDEVWVVGHSQGGYLAHHLLTSASSGSWSNVRKLTGLASGLRPIRLISALRETQSVVRGWLSVLSSTILLVGLLLFFEPGAPGNIIATLLLNRIMLLGLVQPLVFFDVDKVAPVLLDNVWPTNWISIPVIILGLVATLVSSRFATDLGRRLSTVPAPPSKITWEELSSPSDIVGSMSVPELSPHARTRILPSLRQPIGDHLLRFHFSRRSLFRLEMARWLTRGTAASKKFAALDAAAVDLADFTSRTYVLRFVVQAAYVVLLIVLPMMFGVRSLLQTPPVLIYVGVLVALLISALAWGWWWFGAGARLSRFVRASNERHAFQPVGRIRRPRWAVWAVAFATVIAVLVSFGLCLCSEAFSAAPSGTAADALRIGLYESSISTMSVALLAFITLCLIVAGVRGVRPFLLLSGASLINSFTALIAIGDPWLELGVPGGLALVFLGVILLFSLVTSFPKREVGKPA